MIVLLDGTKVPEHYDFNRYFPSLTVQRQVTGTCWYETRAALLEAFARMYDGQHIQLNPEKLSHSTEGWAVEHWADTRAKGFGPLGKTTYFGGDVVTGLPVYKDMPPRDAVCKALWTNGVLVGGVKCQHSFERLFKHPEKYYVTAAERRNFEFSHIPELHTLPGDLKAAESNTWAHATIYCGYHWEKGILVQNSWSKRWGMNGRAYLGWDMIADKVIIPGMIFSWNDHPANELVMPRAT